MKFAALNFAGCGLGGPAGGDTTTSHSDKGPANLRDITTKVEAKWLGPCKADQKAGDIVMPGGLKLNVKDAERLKSLLPKSN